MTVLKAGDVDAFIARPDPKRQIVLIYGADAGLVSERAEAAVRASVKDPADPFAVTRLNGDELAADPARLVDEAQAIPMFGSGGRAIRVAAGARSFAPALEALIANPPRDCRVVIEAGELKRSAPLRDLCERSPAVAVIACYPDTARDIERLIDGELREAGIAIDADARNLLGALLGGDRRASRNEIRKLALYAQGSERITLEHVLAVVADASALVLDELVDAVFARRPREVDWHFAKALGAGTAPGTILSAAIRQSAQLHKLRLAVEGGIPIQDAIGQQVFFRRKPAWETALKGWNAAQLQKAMLALAAAVAQMRRSPVVPESLARQTLLTLARPIGG